MLQYAPPLFPGSPTLVVLVAEVNTTRKYQHRGGIYAKLETTQSFTRLCVNKESQFIVQDPSLVSSCS